MPSKATNKTFHFPSTACLYITYVSLEYRIAWENEKEERRKYFDLNIYLKYTVLNYKKLRYCELIKLIILFTSRNTHSSVTSSSKERTRCLLHTPYCNGEMLYLLYLQYASKKNIIFTKNETMFPYN